MDQYWALDKGGKIKIEVAEMKMLMRIFNVIRINIIIYAYKRKFKCAGYSWKNDGE